MGGASRWGLGVGSGRDVLAATAVVGIIGYAITVMSGAVLDESSYVPFAALWSLTYLVVGSLGGVQQETTRASRLGGAGRASQSGRARRVYVIAAGATTLILVATSPLWVDRVFPDHGYALLWPLLASVWGYLALAVASGILGGLSSWRLVSLATIADGVIRLFLVGICLASGADIVVLAWAVAAPFGLAGVLAAAAVRRAAHGRWHLDVDAPQLAWNASRVVLSGIAMGVLISGFPALLASTTSEARPSHVAAVIFASNLARSPLIVLAMAFQPLLVQRLRDAAAPGATIAQAMTVLAVAGATLTVLAAAAGPWLSRALFGGAYALDAPMLAMLVGSAAPTAMLIVTGATLLARGRHSAYLAGWLSAAFGAVFAFMSPWNLMATVAGSLIASPLLGLAVHVALLHRARTSSGKRPS